MSLLPWQRGQSLTLGTYGLNLWNIPLFSLPLRLPREKAKTHWHLIGTSGSGKSYFLLNLYLKLLTLGFAVTLIDPHGDLAKRLLHHLIVSGVYKDPKAYDQIMYLDLPSAEQAGRFMPYNLLKQNLQEHTIASNFKEAMHRAFPELSQGAATFDTLLPRAIRILIANNLPLTALELFFLHEEFRTKLLARYHDPMISWYFNEAFATLRKSDQIAYAGSVLRRAALLTDLPILKYSFGQQHNIIHQRDILDSGKSMIINLALNELEASRLFGCLLTVGFEQAAKSRAAVPPLEREQLPLHFLLIDEFHNFSTHSGQSFSTMLSQTRKYGLFLGLSHQYWGQASQHLQSALQNVGIDVVFNLGHDDAEYTAKVIGRVDPNKEKHVVKDEDAVGRTHPLYASLAEQWHTFTQSLKDLQQRRFVIKRRGITAREGRTIDMPDPQPDPGELVEVEQEYLLRYFTAKQEIDHAQAVVGDVQLPQSTGIVYEPVARRAKLLEAKNN